MNIFIPVLVIVALTQMSCGAYHKSGELNFPDKSNYKVSELGFSTVQNRVLRTNCVGCHGSGGGINLETYANVKAHLAAVKTAVYETRRMPKAPGAPLTGYQLGLLNAWIEAGAPETAPDEDPPLPLAAEFESIRVNILVPKCQICHSPGKPVARIPLVTKEDLLNSPLDLVLPGNAEESGIFIAISRQDSKMMPPAKDASGNPTGFTRLSDPEIAAIQTWITDGATK